MASQGQPLSLAVMSEPQRTAFYRQWRTMTASEEIAVVMGNIRFDPTRVIEFAEGVYVTRR